MFRGDVWDVRFPSPVGDRPGVVLTTNTLIGRLGAVTIAEITGAEGPKSTHIEVGDDEGLTGRARSWINVTGLHTVPKGKLRRQRGRLTRATMIRVERGVRLYLDLESD